MTSYLIDINVWLALTWRLHSGSRSAHQWLAPLSAGEARLVFCRITQLGFLRLLTNRAVMGDSVLTLGGAFAMFDRWCEDPRIALRDEPAGTEAAFRLAVAKAADRTATKFLMDAYLVGLAEALPATVVTFDKALRRAAAARSVHALLLR